MLTLSCEEIAAIVKGRMIQKGKKSSRGVSIDSRTLRKGQCFFAIRGPHADGHRFLKDVIRKNAAQVVLEEDMSIPENIGCIIVADTIKALGLLAAYYRRSFKGKVIAITGSAGKTTTKEMLSRVLSRKYRVLANSKTENNHFGVPLTIFKLRKSTQILVLECGTNQKGDIDYLGQMANPDGLIYTNIGDSHLEGLKNKWGVFKEKSRLAQYLQPNGFIIYNKDDDYLRKLPNKERKFCWSSFSLDESSDFKAERFSRDTKGYVQFSCNRQRFHLTSRSRADVYNALAVISCARMVKVRYNDIKVGLSLFKGTPGRQEWMTCGGISILYDGYNANPLSFKNALETLRDVETRGRKVVVIGDMNELGPKAVQYHKLVGEDIGQMNFDAIFSLGRLSREVNRAARAKNGKIYNRHFSKKKELVLVLARFLKPGDTVLIKGSRAVKMEDVVRNLQETIKGK